MGVGVDVDVDVDVQDDIFMKDELSSLISSSTPLENAKSDSSAVWWIDPSRLSNGESQKSGECIKVEFGSFGVDRCIVGRLPSRKLSAKWKYTEIPMGGFWKELRCSEF